jgi:predicted metal-dependent peptidase
MILMRLNIHASDKNDTAWTDGQSLGYNPAFIDTLDDATIESVLAHEAAHVAHGHPFRMKPHHDQKRANVAMDHAVNLPLKDYRDKAGRAPFSIPSDWLADAQYTGQSWEEVYTRLPTDQQQNQGQKPSQGQPGPGDVEPYPAASPADLQEAEAANIQAVTQAAQAAAAYGNLPGDIQRLVDELRKPVIHWAEVLRRFLTKTTSESTWKRPNRRAMAGGMYLPSRTGEQCPPLVIAVDTSGSLTADQLAGFEAEVNAVLSDTRPELVTVIYCDSRVKGTEEFTPDELPVTLHAAGGGGTLFQPVFNYVRDNLEAEPAALVYLTDLDGPEPTEQPPYPVLWISTDKRAASFAFGDRVDMQ